MNKNKLKQNDKLKPSKVEKTLPAFFMQKAILQARKSEKKKEVPVGAVIVLDGKIIAQAGNRRETKKDATAHAEILAIRKACKRLNNFRLSKAEMYVTLMPCPMCAGAICASRIKKVYCGAIASEPENKLIEEIFNSQNLNHKVELESGILEDDCKNIITNFFKQRRNQETK